MSATALLPVEQPAVFDLAAPAIDAPAGIVSRTLLQTSTLRVTLFRFAARQELTAHRSSRHALVQILDGRCEFEFGAQWHELAAGSFLHLPPNAEHAVRAGDEPFSMLLILASEPAVN